MINSKYFFLGVGGFLNNCYYCVVEGKWYYGMVVFDYKCGCV